MNDVVAATLELVRVSSVTGDERALCDKVEAQCAGFGSVRRYRDSVVVRGPRRAGRPLVLLAGHLDTVPERQSGPARVEGPWLYGCGASDMKGGVALILDVLSDAPALGCDLVALLYDAEEGPYDKSGLGPVLEGEDFGDVALAVCLEPTDNGVQLGCVGTLHAELVFRGKRAHSARPWEGDNALHRAGALIAELAARTPRPVVIDGLEYREVMSLTLARAGEARNVIPDRCELNLNYRFAPGKALATAQAEVLAFAAGRCEVRFTDLAPSAPPSRAHPLVQRLVSLVGSEPLPKQAWTDVARFAAMGLPALNFGPGDPAQAHQVDERVAVAALERGQSLLRTFLQM